MTMTAEITDYLVAEFAPESRSADLAPDFDLVENGLVSSLGMLRLVSWIGDRYQVPVGNLALSPKDFRTVSAIEEFIALHRPTS